MSETVAVVLLWLFVINLGIVVGAGLYEHRVVVPVWGKSPPQSIAAIDSGLTFWVFVSTVPLTLLTLANLVAAFLATGPARSWWLAAAIIILVERIVTFSYFVPTMVRLQRDQTAAPAAAAAMFARWRQINIARNIASLVAWLIALRALVMLNA